VPSINFFCSGRAVQNGLGDSHYRSPFSDRQPTMKPYMIFAILIFVTGTVRAQMNVGSLLSATSEKLTTTNFYFARPNDLTIIVNIVGFVERPGRYEICNHY
jgi:hypothetical protein